MSQSEQKKVNEVIASLGGKRIVGCLHPLEYSSSGCTLPSGHYFSYGDNTIYELCQKHLAIVMMPPVIGKEVFLEEL